jgi:hypothetical protein
MACYAVSSEETGGKKKCAPVLEDYYECLHHKKEVRFSTQPLLKGLVSRARG